MCHSIEENAWASDFITPTNFWNIDLLSNILPNYIISKVKNISVHVTDPKDRDKMAIYISWKILSSEATWANNNKISPHPKASFLNSFGN